MKKIRSCRRILLNRMLEANKSDIHGNVLDIGGIRNNKKIDLKFESLPNIKSYKILNFAKEASPDFQVDINNLDSFKEQKYNTIISTELIEYLDDPKKFILQCLDMLEPQGILHLTLPLHHSIHGDHHLDKWRITQSGILYILNQKKNISYEITPMGGLLCVIYDFIHADISFNKKSPSIVSKIFFKTLQIFQPLIIIVDSILSKKTKYFITTGYYLKVVKT